jgi:hypothetical protein
VPAVSRREATISIAETIKNEALITATIVHVPQLASTETTATATSADARATTRTPRPPATGA